MGGSTIDRAMVEGVRAARLKRESRAATLAAREIRSQARAIRFERAPLWIEWWPHHGSWRSGPNGADSA